MRQPEESNIALVESRIDDIPQVTEHENALLTSSFTEQEVMDAVFQMEHNKSPGPDGFAVEFYQVFWEIIKKYLLALLHDFYDEPPLV